MMKFPYRLFIMLTSICNLNCNGCGHFCELNQEHGSWFISLEELKYDIKFIKTKMPHLRGIILIGGEPMVHPDFLKICEILRKELPNEDISIATNGLTLHKFSDEELKYIIKDCNIDMKMSIYPTTLNYIKKQYERFKEINLPFHFQGARINFTKFSLNTEGCLDNTTQFEQCSLRLKPEFTLSNKKIYSCCVSPRLDLQDIPEFYNDYLALEDFNHENQLYDLKMSPPNKCKFCGSKDNPETDIMPWHQQSEIENNYCNSLQSLFINYYNEYDIITHNLDNIYKAIQDPLFKEHVDEVFNIDSLSYIYHYMDKNAIDIYIPITNHTNLNFNGNFYNNLAQQTIIKQCNLHFVCLNTNKIQEAIMYQTFTPYKNNTELYSYFYKSDSINNGYKLIQEKGYGKIIYALDIESRDLENPKFLETELKEYL